MRRFRVLLWVWVVLAAGGCGEQRPWNVVLFTFDTTRADFLGCYGKPDAKTPHLDRLASEGFLFEQAMASNPVTQAAHATILTGVYPMAHGVRDNLLFRLPDQSRTLAELLKDRGYATGAAVGGFPLVASFGSSQGFDFYDDDLKSSSLDHRGRPAAHRRRSWYNERPAGHVNDAILPWLRQHMETGRPFFAWLHYWDPHEPHIPPSPYDQLFAHDLYQGEIAYADQSLGALLKAIDEGGELDRTLVVMVADHGESRFDHHEATHAYLAYGSTLHVPLIFNIPGEPTSAGRRVAERVGTVDIVPTILDLLGFDISEERFQGRSLASLMLGAERSSEARSYYSESLSPRLSHGVGELRALYRGPYKYIHGPRPELFNLEEDPGELRDLSAELPEERGRFERALQSFLNEHADAGAAAAVHEVDDETRAGLEALGYLSSTGDAPPAVAETLSTEGAVPQDRVGDINLMTRLRNQLSTGRYRPAVRTALKLLEGDPSNPYYQGRLAAAYVGLGELEKAAEIVEGAEQVSSANLDDFLGVGSALFDAGDQNRGLAMAERLVSAFETLNGRWALAEMRRERGDHGGLEAELKRALEMDEKHRGVRLMWAEHLASSGDVEKAEAIYLKWISDFPVGVEGLLSYAELLHQTHRGDQALSLVERVLRLAPWFCKARLEHVKILLSLDRRDEASRMGLELKEACLSAPNIQAQVSEVLEELALPEDGE